MSNHKLFESKPFIDPQNMRARIPEPNYLPLWEDLAPKLPAGDIIEFGCYDGASTRQLATLFPARRVWALDTFRGTPAEDHRAVDARHIAPGVLGEFPLPSRELFPVPPYANICPLQGRFTTTLPCIPDDAMFALAFIDCNLYESTAQALAFVRGRMYSGGYILVDDYGGFTGVRRAVDEFMGCVTDPNVILDQYKLIECRRQEPTECSN